jgi:uncharacterized protein DUF2382
MPSFKLAQPAPFSAIRYGGTVRQARGSPLKAYGTGVGGVLSKQKAQTAAIPVFDEELRVDKTVKDTDRVFIRNSVLERTEFADLELRSGEAIIERVPVDRVVDSAPDIRQATRSSFRWSRRPCC